MKKILLSVLVVIVGSILIISSCSKAETNHQSESRIESSNDFNTKGPIKWFKALKGLLGDKRVEIEFGQNQENCRCCYDQMCTFKGGIANHGLGEANGYGKYIDGALEIAFYVETITPYDMLNFTSATGTVILSNPVVYNDFEEAADSIGLPIGFELLPGVYPIIYTDEEFIVVRFE
jgi:hypothetical protein